MGSWGFPDGLVGKESVCMHGTQETQIRPLGGGDPREEEMATHSSIHVWRIAWREEPGYSPWGDRVAQDRGAKHFPLSGKQSVAT